MKPTTSMQGMLKRTIAKAKGIGGSCFVSLAYASTSFWEVVGAIKQSRVAIISLSKSIPLIYIFFGDQSNGIG